MISSGANVIMLQSRANVIIWCYHVMLASGMITPPFFIFPENFTHSFMCTEMDVTEIILAKIYSFDSHRRGLFCQGIDF